LKEENEISKINSNLTISKVNISLTLTKKIIHENRINWWQDLEYNWKVILIANYCFNYDEHIKWNIRDCYLEQRDVPEHGNETQFLLNYASWVYGNEDFNLTDCIQNIPLKVLDFIIDKTRFLWCSNVNVSNLEPLNKLSKLKEVGDLGCSVSEPLIKILSQKLGYFSYYDPNSIGKIELGKMKTWDEYNK
jgi:hypothetical protein